jgi:transposase
MRQRPSRDEGPVRGGGELDVVPRRFIYKNHRRQKYTCSCGSCIDTALGPDKLVPGGRYSIAFAIYVAISKYCDHLPLERLVRMMARDGLVVTSQTLWDQIERLTWTVESGPVCRSPASGARLHAASNTAAPSPSRRQRAFHRWSCIAKSKLIQP